MIIIFTDLDETLLDGEHYSYEPAVEALKEISIHRLPLVIASSKTKKEIECIRGDMGNDHPFVSENGGAIFIPDGYFPFPVDCSVKRDGYLVIESGISYTLLTEFLDGIVGEHALPVMGFHSLALETISDITGLSMEQSAMAQEREYDESFVFNGDHAQWKMLEQLIVSRGFTLTRGGKFNHLSGTHNKGTGVRMLIDLYRRQYPDALTVGLGDAANDLPFLRMVDYPVLLPKADGTYEPGIDIQELHHAPQPGPAGWNSVVLELIRRELPR